MRRLVGAVLLLIAGSSVAQTAGAATRAPGAGEPGQYVKIELIGEWHSSWHSKLSEFQQAERSTTLDAAWDFVYGPELGSPSTYVRLSALEGGEGDTAFLALLHEYARGHDDTLDVRAGASCSVSMHAGSSGTGVSEVDSTQGEETIWDIADQMAMYPADGPSACLGADVDNVSLSQKYPFSPVGLTNFTFSPTGSALDFNAVVRSDEHGGGSEALAEANLTLRQSGQTLVALTRAQASSLAGGREASVPWSFSYAESTSYEQSSFSGDGDVIFSLSSPAEPGEAWSPGPVTQAPALNGDLARLDAKSSAFQKSLLFGLYAVTATAATAWAGAMASTVPPAIVLSALSAAAAFAYAHLYTAAQTAYTDPPASTWRVVPHLSRAGPIALPPGTPAAVRALAANDQQIALAATAMSSAIDRASSAEAAHDAIAADAQLAAARRFTTALAGLCEKEPVLAADAWQALRNSLDWAKLLTGTAWQTAVDGIYAHPMSATVTAELKRLGFSDSDLRALQSQLATTPSPAMPTPEQLVTENSSALGSFSTLLAEIARSVEVPM
jgi:hypothetical protein